MSPTFAYRHPRPMATADAAVFSVAGGRLRVLLIERGHDPFKGCWALPGGFVDMDEDLADAAARELEEETGLKGVALGFFGAYGRPGRDPRGRTISSAWLGILPCGRAEIRAGDDAARALWHPAHRPPPLAFDHAEILKDAREKLKAEVLNGDGAFRFLAPRFAVAELRTVFEAVLRMRIPGRRFASEMKRLGLLKDAPGGLKRLCRGALSRRRKENALFRFS